MIDAQFNPRAHFHPALIPQARELCTLVGNYRGALPDGDWLAQEKRDGWRCLYFKGRDGRKRLWSRNGVPLEGVGHILHRIAQMEAVAGVDMMFDGEFQVDGTLAATKAWCESGWKAGGEAGTLHLFDCQTQTDWEAGGSDAPLYERLRVMESLFEKSHTLSDEWAWREGTKGREPPHPHVTTLSANYVETHADVMDMAQRVWSRGGEGLVLKRADSGYVRERSNEWLKVKRQAMR